MITLSFSACGKDQPGIDQAYQPGSNLCSNQLITAYNGLIESEKKLSSSSNLDQFESQVQSFETQFKDVNCKANVKDSDPPELMDIDANKTVNHLNEKISFLRQTPIMNFAPNQAPKSVCGNGKTICPPKESRSSKLD